MRVEQAESAALRTLRAKMRYPMPHSDLTDAELHLAIRRGLITMGGYRKDKIYGKLRCWSGKKMFRQYRVFFASEEQALACGYRPCGHCMPREYAAWKARQAEHRLASARAK